MTQQPNVPQEGPEDTPSTRASRSALVRGTSVTKKFRGNCSLQVKAEGRSDHRSWPVTSDGKDRGSQGAAQETPVRGSERCGDARSEHGAELLPSSSETT